MVHWDPFQDADGPGAVQGVLPSHLGVIVPIVLADVVARSDRRRGVAQGQIGLGAWLEADHLEAFDVQGVVVCFRANLRRSTLCPFGQDISESLAVGNCPDHAQHRLCFAEAEGHPQSLFGEHPLLDTLHGHRQGEAKGRRVQTEVIA